MRAIVVTRHGGPEVLELEDRPAPEPGPGELLGWIAAGELDVRIGGRYPLEDAARAQADLESRATTGKLILRP